MSRYGKRKPHRFLAENAGCRRQTLNTRYWTLTKNLDDGVLAQIARFSGLISWRSEDVSPTLNTGVTGVLLKPMSLREKIYKLLPYPDYPYHPTSPLDLLLVGMAQLNPLPGTLWADLEAFRVPNMNPWRAPPPNDQVSSNRGSVTLS